MPQFADHKLHWEPGQEGKGFIIRPTPNGIKHWPELTNVDPVIWTWPTQGMKPTHSQMGTKTIYEVPQGMAPDQTSNFHIQPDGGVYQFGSGRVLNDSDHQAINEADSNLTPIDPQPESEYGHANRLLEILGMWRRIPNLWRETPRS